MTTPPDEPVADDKNHPPEQQSFLTAVRAFDAARHAPSAPVPGGPGYLQAVRQWNAARQSPPKTASFYDLFDDPKPAAPPVDPQPYSGTDHPYALAALRDECAQLAAMPPDSGRNSTLNKAGFNIGGFVGGGHIARERVFAELTDAARASGLSEKEIRDTLRPDTSNSPVYSGERYPRRVPDTDTTHTSGTTAIPPATSPDVAGNVSRPPSTGPAPTPLSRLREGLLTRADLANLPQPQPLITDTIDRNTVALLAGYRATGKSFIALDWSCCVATGKPWQGREVQPGRVLYVASEGAEGLHRRVSAWEFAWHHQVTDLTVYPRAVQLSDAAERDALEQVCRDGHFALVVLDTLARCAVGLDENSAKDMGLIVDAADRVKRAAGCTVLLVHHTGKDRATIRGSSALEAGVDTVYLTEGDQRLIKLTRDKRKDGPLEDSHNLRLAVTLASCVVESVRATEQRSERADQLYRLFADTFADTGASKAELRLVAGLPPATFHRALNVLVNAGSLVDSGTDARPFYRLKRRT